MRGTSKSHGERGTLSRIRPRGIDASSESRGAAGVYEGGFEPLGIPIRSGRKRLLRRGVRRVARLGARRKPAPPIPRRETPGAFQAGRQEGIGRALRLRVGGFEARYWLHIRTNAILFANIPLRINEICLFLRDNTEICQLQLWRI